jgi:hypothetical protein
MATSRLANILQQEYKTKGLIGGAASSLGKRSLEKLDIRNALFSGGGIGSIIGTKIFGKGYSATRNNTASNASQRTSPSSLTSDSSSILQDINTNSKITAKNSMALPAMAKQMNMMQKNIGNLTQYMTGKKSKGPDSYFKDASFRENAYESQFKAGDKQPTKVEGKEKSGGLLGLIGPIISLIGGVISAFASKISAIVASVGILSGIFTALGLAAASLSGVFKKILRFFIRSPLGRLLGLAAVAGAALGASSEANAGTIDAPNDGEEIDQNKPSMGEKIGYTAGAAALGAIGVNSIKKNLTPPAKTPGALTQLGDVGAKRAAAQTKWGKFLIWLERKAPRLFARIGVKLAAMGGLAAIPIAGWIGAIISAGFLIWDAYYVYQLWTEYSGSPESKDSESNIAATSPTILEETNYDVNGNVTGPTPSSTASATNSSSTGTTPSSTSSANVDLPKGGSISSSEAIDHLVKQGLTPAQAAGVVGNLVQESKLNSGAQNKSEGSYGLAQWRLSRLADLTSFAASKGKDIGDPKTQLDFIMHELRGKEKKAGQMLFASKTAEEAANNFGTYYERPKTVEASRAKYASKALAEYKPGTGGSSDTMLATSGADIATYGEFAAGVDAIAGSTPSVAPAAPKISGPAVATASAAKESAASNKSAFSSADMADILSVIGGPKTSGSSGGSGMNQVVSTSKSTPYHSDFYSNLVRTQAL